jgi:chitodextrinase
MLAARPNRPAIVVAVLALAMLLPSAVSGTAAWRTLEGSLVVAHGDAFAADPARSRSTFVDRLVTASGEVSLAFRGKRPEGFFNGATVRVRGTLAGRTLTVGPSRADASVLAAAAAATGPRKLAVLLVKFSAAQAEPWTIAQAQATVFSASNSVASYFAEESYGLLTVTGDVFGYYTISIDTSQCDYLDIGTKARAAATAAGVNLANYTQIQYAFPNLASCGWAGLAYVPGRDSWINNALNLRVSAHELSHNFGVHHASTISCSEGGVRVTLSSNAANCTSSEYGDPFSIMGAASTRHTHNQQLASMGWITGSGLQTITTAGSYTFGAAENAGATPRAVRIARGNGTWLYLELRVPFGASFDNFSASDPAVTGVSLRISNDWTTIVQSQLLDTTPATTTYADAPLAAGRSLWDPVSGVTVTTTSVSGGTATVSVGWGGDTIAPSTPGSPAVAATGASTARFTWTASTDNVGVTGYRVSRGGVVRGTVTTTQFNDTGLVPGTTYQYSVVALDAATNVSGAATKSFTMPQPDTTAPTAPANLRATSLTKARAYLAWNASTDAVGVTGYRVYRNGALVATTTGLTWSDARQRVQSTYKVVAFDAAGNVSAQSNNLVIAAK